MNHGLRPSDISVTFELSDFEKSNVKVLFVYNNDGKYTVNGFFSDISSYGEEVNCIGAFVFGYIPFSYVSSIIFNSEDDAHMFINSSPDMWFPKSLFTTWENSIYKTLPKMPEIIRKLYKEI